MQIPKYFYFRVKPGKFDITLEDASDVDVAEVVRCRECKHAKQTNDGYYACVWSAVLTGAGWFCCHGERKGGDD